MGQCLSALDQPPQGQAYAYPPAPQQQQGYQQQPYPPPTYYPPVPGQQPSYAAAASAGAPPGGQPYAQQAPAAGYTICKALFFPDPALPCHNARKPGGCRRQGCTYAHGQTSLTQLLEVLSSAKQTLVVCVFTITCDEIADTVIEAHRRGVRVRVISDDDQAKTQGSDVLRLKQAGIPVRVDNNPTHMHHKFAVVDGRVLITGSFNWTRQAVVGNCENVVILDTPHLVAQFGQQFEALWAKFKDI